MLRQLLLETVRCHGSKTALVYGATRLSYRELAGAVAAQAALLRERGVGPGVCVALLLPNSPAFVIGFLATAALGAVVLPLNPALAANEIAHSLADCRAAVLISDAAQASACQRLLAEAGLPTGLLVAPETPAAAALTLAPDAPHHGPVLYQYSSGSTGRPKKVCRTQANLRAEADNFVGSAGVTPADVILCVVPLFHAHGLGNAMLAALAAGATLLLPPVLRRDAQTMVPFAARVPEMLDLIARERVSLIPGVAQTFEALAAAPAELTPDLSSLRLCFTAGNSLPREVFTAFQRRFGICLRQLYGCTEVGSFALNLDPDSAATWASVGRPLGDNRVAVVDELRNPLPPGATGELVIFSRALTDGYVGAPEANAEAFHAGGFFTGDLGAVDAHGRITISGRKRLFIDTAGYKVNPLEVEDVILTHPAVREAAVVGIPQPGGKDELIKAFVVLDGPCTPAAIIAHCRAGLAEFKVPRAVTFLEELPYSPLGKLLRKDLLAHPSNQAPDAPAAQRAALLALPSAEQRCLWLERFLREQIGRVTGLAPARIDPERAMTDFGLNSVMAVELKRELESLLAIELSATLVWNYPSVNVLAAHLAHTLQAPAAAAVPAPAARHSDPLEDALLDQLSDAEALELLLNELEAS